MFLLKTSMIVRAIPCDSIIGYINVYLYSLYEKIEMIFINLNLGDLFIFIIILQHIK
jgi:hypothetical protein